jgi:hypothetical protein
LTHIKDIRPPIPYAGIITTREAQMEFANGLGEKAIQDVMASDPAIGDILARFDIGCITCRVGICLLKDVVAIHGLSKDDEAKIEAEINNYLATKG